MRVLLHKKISIFVLFLILILRTSGLSLTDGYSIPVEASPQGVAIDPHNNIAVIANEHLDSVSIVSLDTETIIAKIPVGQAPRGAAIDPELKLAFISNSGSNSVSVIDLHAYRCVATIPVGQEPEGIAVNPVTHEALVANHKDQTLSVIDIATLTHKGVIPVGQEPIDTAIDPELGLALAVNEKDYAISIISLEEHRVIDAILLGKKPLSMDTNPRTHMAAVANEKDSTITVINFESGRSREISVCKHPIDVAINQLDNRVLVVCDEDRSLLLIDPRTDTIVKTYSLNKLPGGMAINSFSNVAAVTDSETDSLTLIKLPNPVPKITSLVPALVYRGSSGESVVIEGEGFIKTSRAYVQNHLIETIFISNDQLHVRVPEALLSEAGIAEITVVNPEPEGGVSNMSQLQIHNPAPTISSLAPLETAAGTASLDLTVHGTGFFGDSALFINEEQRTFSFLSRIKLLTTFTEKDLEFGQYFTVTVANSEPGGGASNPATFTVLNPVPELTGINPDKVVAGSPGLILTLTGSNFVKTSEIILNNEHVSTQFRSNNHIEAVIPATAIMKPGIYPVKIVNPAPGGGETTPLNFSVIPPLEIKITSPVNGETINRAKTMIKGIYKSDTKDIGITVNGVVAEIAGNEWIANNVPLSVGTNTMTATIKDSQNNAESASISIATESVAQPVTLSANITSGISPLTTYFTVSTEIPNPIVSYQLDFEGDGMNDYAGTAFDDINHSYSTEGIFYSTITVTDDQGNSYSDTIAVAVLSKEEIDAVLKEKWEGMKKALERGDIDGALRYFIETSQERYRKVFEALDDKLPIIVDTFVEFNILDVFDYTAEYEIVANENGVLYSYPGLFVKDEKGIWKFRDF